MQAAVKISVVPIAISMRLEARESGSCGCDKTDVTAIKRSKYMRIRSGWQGKR